jgi:carnitine O-acetyltransferase
MLRLSRTLFRSRQYSSASTFANQESLPNLPVPSIKETSEKYLASVRPLCNETEYETVKTHVEDFIKPDGLGHSLQERLLNYGKGKRNWLKEMWLGIYVF